MTLEEFKRPYTDAELRAKFESTGLDESLWNFCQDIYYNFQTYLADDFGWPRDGESIDQLIVYLKEEDGWESESTREEAWRQAMSKEHIEVYLDQRAKGHGHHWSWIAAVELDWNGNISWDAVLYDLKQIDETLANNEVEIFLNLLAEGKPEAYRKYLEELISPKGSAKRLDEVEACAKPFLDAYTSLYDQFIELGCDHDEIYNYAKDLAEDHHEIFYRAYMVAVEHKATATDSYSFANKVEEIQGNGLLPLESKKFCQEFNEVWQREFYHTLMVEECVEKGEPIGVVCKNQLRESLGLPPLNEALTHEDEEYLRIKKELIESGVNEVSADRKAYEIAFGTNSEEDSILHNAESEPLKDDII